jgi:hypothetical protein
VIEGDFLFFDDDALGADAEHIGWDEWARSRQAEAVRVLDIWQLDQLPIIFAEEVKALVEYNLLLVDEGDSLGTTGGTTDGDYGFISMSSIVIIKDKLVEPKIRELPPQPFNT